jgi:hypothetical protein
MNSCNSLLEGNANLTSQVTAKEILFERFDDDIIKIDDIVKTSNKSIRRVWRDVKEGICQRRGQNRASFNNEVLSVLRISHIITSICRTLLYKAGQPSGTGTPETVKSYLESLLKTITDSPNLIKTHFQDKGVLDEIRNVIINCDETDDFPDTYRKLRKLSGNIVLICDNLYEELSAEPKQHSSKTLNPPVYVVMWDMRNSTSVDNRNDIEQQVILPVNEKIKTMLKNNRNPFQVFEESSDDGNCFLTNNFNRVISAFTIISGVASENNVAFRMGCDVNYEGELHVYNRLKTNLFAGRAFEYAARTTSLYKEVKNDHTLWTGEPFIYDEPPASYLLVSEFAKRKAYSDNQWNFSNINILEFNGEYLPRVKQGTSIPYKVYQLTI